MNSAAPPQEVPWIEVVRRDVSSLRFGVLEIVVHEGRVTQIERTEKFRLDRGATVPASPAASPPSPA